MSKLFLIITIVIAATIDPKTLVGEEARLELAVADDDLTAPGPIVVMARLRNIGSESVYLPSPFGAAPGTLFFQILGPDEQQFRSIGACMQNEEESFGGAKIELEAKKSICSYEVLLSRQEHELDRKGIWKIRGVVYLKPGSPIYSEPAKVFVRDLPKEAHGRARRLNEDVEQLLRSYRVPMGISSTVLERLTSDARELPEAREFVAVFEALDKIHDAETPAELKMAQDKIESLRKLPTNEIQSRWTSLVAAWAYLGIKRADLATKEIERLDKDLNERPAIAKRIHALQELPELPTIELPQFDTK